MIQIMSEFAILALPEFAQRVLASIGVDDPGDVQPHSGLFDDLALDSLQALQLLFAVEAMSGTDVPPPELPEIYTIGDAYDYYVHLVGDRS